MSQSTSGARSNTLSNFVKSSSGRSPPLCQMHTSPLTLGLARFAASSVPCKSGYQNKHQHDCGACSQHGPMHLHLYPHILDLWYLCLNRLLTCRFSQFLALASPLSLLCVLDVSWV